MSGVGCHVCQLPTLNIRKELNCCNWETQSDQHQCLQKGTVVKPEIHILYNLYSASLHQKLGYGNLISVSI
jgi:hypothetical protein